MRAVTDLFDFVASSDVEFDAAAVDFRNHCFGGYAVAGWRCSDVANIYRGANRTLARVEIVSHRI